MNINFHIGKTSRPGKIRETHRFGVRQGTSRPTIDLRDSGGRATPPASEIFAGVHLEPLDKVGMHFVSKPIGHTNFRKNSFVRTFLCGKPVTMWLSNGAPLLGKAKFCHYPNLGAVFDS